MADQDKLIEPTRTVWEGLAQYGSFPAWLSSARDTRQVAQSLIRAIPEFTGGQWNLLNCDVGHIRFKNEYWTALYRITVQPSASSAGISLVDGETSREIQLQGKVYPPGHPAIRMEHVEGMLGAPGWTVVLPSLNLVIQTREPETVLSSLEFLTDPEQSRQFLETSIRSGSPAYSDLRIRTCSPNVVRYKPGSRCTVVYRLDYDPELAKQKNWPPLVVAKTYRGEKGQNAYDSMAALWNSPLGSSHIVTLAEPLAYLPNRKVLVQGPIFEEQTLKDLISSVLQQPAPASLQELETCLRKTARGLAALHHTNVMMGRPWTWTDEMAEVQNQVDRLAGAVPYLQPAAAPLLDRLNMLAALEPPDPSIPSHGSFRPAQVLIYQGEIGFIDFDSFCQSEPANDLALFLGTVLSIALTPVGAGAEDSLRQPMDSALRRERYQQALRLNDLFLEEYAHYHAVSRRRVALWTALDLFMFVLHGWTKIKVGELEDILFLLDQFLVTSQIMEAS